MKQNSALHPKRPGKANTEGHCEALEPIRGCDPNAHIRTSSGAHPKEDHPGQDHRSLQAPPPRPQKQKQTSALPSQPCLRKTRPKPGLKRAEIDCRCRTRQAQHDFMKVLMVLVILMTTGFPATSRARGLGGYSRLCSLKLTISCSKSVQNQQTVPWRGRERQTLAEALDWLLIPAGLKIFGLGILELALLGSRIIT